MPRAVSSAVAATRREPAHGVPARRLGPREFGETYADELFIALAAMYRQVPSMEAVERSVAECAEAAPALVELGVSGVHRAPPPLRVLDLQACRFGPLRFEHLKLESRPRMPDALVAAGHDGTEVAHTRLLRHGGGPRPWVVWVHGAEQGRVEDLFAFRARYLHEELGLNVALPVLPRHGPRRSAGASYPGFDLLGNVATTVRAVSDVRALLDWMDVQGGTSTSVVGMSLGGPVAALVAGLDPRVDGVAVVVPMLDPHTTMAHHLHRTGTRGRRLAALLRDESVAAVTSVIDPGRLDPHAPPSRRLVVAALNDRMTSARAAQRLNAQWGGTMHWHTGGHIGHLLSRETRVVIDEFLRRRS
jgi:dienelactone hydrolase